MVAVDDLDPPGEAKIKSESMGVPPSAPPKEAFAEWADAWGTGHWTCIPKSRTAKRKATSTLFIRARALFRRFSNGLHMIMAVRLHETPRKSEVTQEQTIDVSAAKYGSIQASRRQLRPA
jgi:hypothetical protein